ncbi:hypothetical protein [Chitinophaga sp. CB10]|uniref:hypothetical protein n=1 Tax=Chitinophaga sp. CB10 TaxID=1891659 RepID=UPI0025C455D7|nr:hypothetical protein [Chitinophaga sp. CB10]
MKRIISSLPLAVIFCLMVYTIYVVSTTNIIFSYEHYIGLTLIVFAIVALPFSRKASTIATFVALLLATFSIAAFTPIISRVRLGYTINGRGLDLVLQPYCILLLVLFLIFNWKYLYDLKKEWFGKSRIFTKPIDEHINR